MHERVCCIYTPSVIAMVHLVHTDYYYYYEIEGSGGGEWSRCVRAREFVNAL